MVEELCGKGNLLTLLDEIHRDPYIVCAIMPELGTLKLNSHTDVNINILA